MSAQPMTLAEVVARGLARQLPGWRPQHTQILNITSGLMADGSTEYRITQPSGQRPEVWREILVGAARSAGLVVSYRCVCGQPSPAAECEDCQTGSDLS